MFISPDDRDEYKSVYGPLSQENVSQFNTSIVRNDGSLLFVRIIHFDCDGVGFNVCFAADPLEHSRGLAPSFKVTANGVPGSTGRSERVSTSTSLGNGALNITRIIARRNASGTQSSHVGRSSTRRACLVVDKVTESSERNPMGPRIIFASSSFSQIANIDACDVQGTPFMSLVPPEDVIKTARFLEQVSKSEDVVIDCLRFRVADDQTNRRSSYVPSGAVDIEVMAAGSEDGIILLCQQIRSGRLLSNGSFDSDGYMSLEEIISSDVESSDLADQWAPALY
ncbi:hypothetical protein GGI23_001413 [Coemansia sp. RSA 2559]|nr:hypothetical protein GGI23_001413 [Coemansia sp. RSA 2559]KAJ2864977.1 hypothetical protein GGI22_001603 [Coemansia erecta]